jgi:hypothetical protein
MLPAVVVVCISLVATLEQAVWGLVVQVGHIKLMVATEHLVLAVVAVEVGKAAVVVTPGVMVVVE